MARRSNAARRDASAARRREGIRSQPLKRAATAAVALLALARGARAADPPGSPRANQALAVCLADAATPAERRANLARGLALAEEAVAADERDPKAHFAVFCNLGNDLKLRGGGVPRADARRARAPHAAAGVGRAEGDVAVVACGAHDGVRTDAHPAVAHVGPCTGVAVVAGGAVLLGRVGALAGGRVAAAGVVTLIRRSAGDGVRARAPPRLAGVGLRASVAVVAGAAVRLRRVRARAGGGVAGAGVVA